ncbi:SGNH/GDSL hydrolase family protein [Actinomycetospora chiangmaiensis]|uniref:SGNH/GDSL hydrolase family protein n=1 Tax=Actinomycetospora chiangmaiensis TaxID=402650 RepID=UPI00035D5C14|nr:SGNH/GDSL hydrolase family protein [Actinomycetospora chiangmaiensis]
MIRETKRGGARPWKQKRGTRRGSGALVLAVLRRGFGLLVLAVLLAWGRGLAAAQTMEADHAAYWRRRRRSPGSLTLVALGDSLSQGLGSTDPSSSWAGRLAAAWEERSTTQETQRSGARHRVRVRVVVLGVVGATAADVLRDQLPVMPPADLVALGVGTNDAAQGVTPEQYRETFRALCAALPAGSLVADVPDLQRGAVRRNGVELAAVAREVLAEFPHLRPVALEAATHRMWPWQFGPDLAHPNRLGYARHGAAFVAALPG